MTLQYKITHVFCPLRLPDGDDHSHSNDLTLAGAVCGSAFDYSSHLDKSSKAHWKCVEKLLQNLEEAMRFPRLEETVVTAQLESMTARDAVAYLIRAQNAAVVFRRGAEETIAESFELSPTVAAVMGSCGKLVCSYPGPAIAVPNAVFDDAVFRLEPANLLCRMNTDNIDAAPKTSKGGSTVSDARDTVLPRYITELLTVILRAVGRPTEVQRIKKRIGDDVVWHDARLPWRRSPLWSTIRAVLQTTLVRNGLGLDGYKAFMLFFMNGLAGEAIEHEMSDDILHWVSAKISRRLTKLGDSVHKCLSAAVLRSCTNIRTLLDERWRRVQDNDAFSPTWNPLSLNFLTDTQLSLLDSHKYIGDVLNPLHSAFQPVSIAASGHLHGGLDDFLSMTGDLFQECYKANPRFTLYDVERAVSHGIDGWVAAVLVDDTAAACEKLELLASKYSSAARETYEGNPEDFSRMLLTVIELWVAIDKLLTQQIPMLHNYSPEIPISLLERLLLREARDIQRLCLASGYIRKRHSQVINGWSVFSDRLTKKNFAVRFVNQDCHMQALRDRIVDTASQERQAKVEELKQSNERYHDITRRAADTDHDYRINRRGAQKHRVRKCGKCKLESESRIDIRVHEWPLPTDRYRAAMAVFELNRPVAFDMWRSITCLLLIDICSPPLKEKQPHTCLGDYSALRPYLTEPTKSRVTLASDTKPFKNSHYCSVFVPTKESSVCVNNGLNFYYFDKHTHVSPSDAFATVDISGPSSYQLPPGPYQTLQRYLQHTDHTSNEVLCRQTDCDGDLSIHEFIAYGHLRSAPSLQWLNILREIRANTLTLRRDEVHMLFAQAASQVGPVSSAGKLTWHVELELTHFRHSLLGELETLVSTVSGNWLEGLTMDTVSFLVSRMLSATAAVQDHSYRRALELLRTVRDKTFRWVLELLHKLEQATCEAEKEQHRGRLRDLAAICRSTFEVGLDDSALLLDSSRALEILVCCALVIHNNAPSKYSALGGVSRLLMERDRRLSWKLEELVGSMILKGSDGIDLGIKRVWPGYRKGTRWRRVGGGNHSWFTTNTPISTTQCSQQVNFDVLNGTLLVDGRPMGRMPDEIRADPTFALVFGSQAPDIIPADMTGMEYAARGLVGQYRVYFRMGTDGLIIRAQNETDPDVFELIPPQKLASDLPAALVENHVHWFNLMTRTLEARPIERLWEPSPDNWKLHFSPGCYSMVKGDTKLFDVRSQTWQMLSERLQPLENSRNLMIMLENSSTVSVDLPRYGLSFFINDDRELECRHPRGMVYDECQSTGTLIGLASKLVLRPNANSAGDDARRLVLVPEGDVSFVGQGDHVRVTIDISGPVHRRFRCQMLQVDADLGCLVGNASLASNLYRAYLHALTSKPCSVDPLTQKTGTEEALSILRSAACRSFMKVDTRSAQLLCRIAELTARRTWYPEHLKCMQTVHWLAGLPVASQHHGFYYACSSIKEIQQQLQVFHDGQSAVAFEDFLPDCDDHLLRRAAVRATMLYPQTLDDSLPSGRCDTVYEARNVQLSSANELRAYRAALAVHNWSAPKCTANKILALVESWKTTLLGSSSAFPLRYYRGWLSPDLPASWLSLYDSCRMSQAQQHRFQLIFSLPAMAHASPKLEDVVGTLLAFVTIPQFKNENPPDYPLYNLSDGYTPPRDMLNKIVSRRARPYRDSVTPQEYKERLERDTGEAITKMTAAWPYMKPRPSSDFLDSAWYNTDALDSELGQLFTSCYRNSELKNHLKRVESILGQNAVSSFPQSFDTLPAGQHVGYSFATPNQGHHRVNRDVTLGVLFCRPVPAIQVSEVTSQSLELSLHANNALRHPPVTVPSQSQTWQTRQISQLISGLRRNASTTFQLAYVNGLQQSANHLGIDRTHLVESLRTHYEKSRKRYMSALTFLAEYLGPRETSELAVYKSGQWPRITAKVLLGCLASTSQIPLPHDWRVCLIKFAKLALECQRARRMLALEKHGEAEDLHKEMENAGCDGWEAESYVDWLLIQLDGDFLLRRVQVDITLEMIAPHSGKNTVLQLNMGEGKSSVIVPATASVLGDGRKLVRVVVPKALASQMFHLLVDRLGGLANRRIFYLPFSRSLHINRSGARAIQAILEQCTRERGILVVQPEHILSFKLLSIEKQLGNTADIAEELLRT